MFAWARFRNLSLRITGVFLGFAALSNLAQSESMPLLTPEKISNREIPQGTKWTTGGNSGAKFSYCDVAINGRFFVLDKLDLRLDLFRESPPDSDPWEATEVEMDHGFRRPALLQKVRTRQEVIHPNAASRIAMPLAVAVFVIVYALGGRLKDSKGLKLRWEIRAFLAFAAGSFIAYCLRELSMSGQTTEVLFDNACNKACIVKIDGRQIVLAPQTYTKQDIHLGFQEFVIVESETEHIIDRARIDFHDGDFYIFNVAGANSYMLRWTYYRVTYHVTRINRSESSTRSAWRAVR